LGQGTDKRTGINGECLHNFNDLGPVFSGEYFGDQQPDSIVGVPGCFRKQDHLVVAHNEGKILQGGLMVIGRS